MENTDYPNLKLLLSPQGESDVIESNILLTYTNYDNSSNRDYYKGCGSIYIEPDNNTQGYVLEYKNLDRART